MIEYAEIEKAFSFYDLDDIYKDRCRECIKAVRDSGAGIKVFDEVHEKLYGGDFCEVEKMWDVKNVDELFGEGVDPFVTNVMILLGWELHWQNMNKFNLEEKQKACHKRRVKECFEKDIKDRGMSGVRVSQMLWAVYFIRANIIEVGRLQYSVAREIEISKFPYRVAEGEKIIEMHIPEGGKLDMPSVKESISASKTELEKIFGLENCLYTCNSWLLSKQLHEIVDEGTNIYKFQELFRVRDGRDCLEDVLDHVYKLDECSDYSLLPENTSLQRKIKEYLMKGGKFNYGYGELKMV